MTIFKSTTSSIDLSSSFHDQLAYGLYMGCNAPMILPNMHHHPLTSSNYSTMPKFSLAGTVYYG